mmetsp:Transcript_31417/g.73354  ORF Transcript_31417/g.73354 Transcript_31417/m.73354 type:complete len:475 (+) Transcript_31417:139-1563(+)
MVVAQLCAVVVIIGVLWLSWQGVEAAVTDYASLCKVQLACCSILLLVRAAAMLSKHLRHSTDLAAAPLRLAQEALATLDDGAKTPQVAAATSNYQLPSSDTVPGGGFPPEAHVRFMDFNTGRLGYSNQPDPATFDSEVGSGTYVLLHRPISPSDPDALRLPLKALCSPAVNTNTPLHQRKWHLDNYFWGKRRTWEVRFQIKFKRRVPASTLRFGTQPAERLPLTAAQTNFHKMVLSLAAPVVGDFYNTPGDDPAGRTWEDTERPITSVCVCEADQYACAMPWEVPPGICDPDFPEYGMRKKADPVAYKKMIRNRIFEAGETHTFAFWGPAWFTDVIRWKMVKMPILRGLSLDLLNGTPPLVLTLYIKRSKPGETRHLDHLMEIVWRAGGWPSMYELSEERKKRLLAIGPKNSSGRAFMDCHQVQEVAERQLSQQQHQRRRVEAEYGQCCTMGIQKMLRLKAGTSSRTTTSARAH